MAGSMGIDVGTEAKGLDVVVLEADRSVRLAARRVSLEDLGELIEDQSPDAVAIDAPPALAQSRRRRTEVFVTSLGLSLHTTPTVSQSPDVFPGPWMAVGRRVYDVAKSYGYPLFSGREFSGTAFEVYPYASAVVLDGQMKPKGVSKGEWRRQVLRRFGIDVARLAGQDLVDAGLAALTGLFALEGRACWEGDPSEGVIVLPCRRSDLPASYRPRSLANVVREVRLQQEETMAHKYTNPDAVSKPGAYTHVVEATGSRIVFISGQVALDKDGNVVGPGDLEKQADQVFQNLQACLESVGATFADVTKMTTFIVGYQAGRDRAILGRVREKYLPKDHLPASTLVGVYALATPEIMIEIEATAVLP